LTAARRTGITSRLTVPLSARYKAALAAVLLSLPGVSLAERVAGAVLPDEAVKVAENRFKVAKSYDDTLKFYRSVYAPGKYRRRPIADQPAVKAVHIENPDAKPGGWEGLNVYEVKGETRVFVLVRPKR
jgi:hypothetical protein